jgi:peptide chain release factor 3
VLTAVDAALMVIDAANGVEPQTRRLLQVCRARNTPILTFVNKMDREVKEPLDLMEEIERELGMEVVPFTWPVGMGKSLPRRDGPARRADARLHPGPGPRFGPRADDEILAGLDNPAYASASACSSSRRRARSSCSPTPRPPFDRDAFLAGRQTPMFFGSAINNFGVREVLDALVDLAPPPADRAATQRVVHPDEPKFSGVVFKIQANMDPAHRDRIAFVRVASGHFERGMRSRSCARARSCGPNTVVSFLSQRRELLDEAYAGDIIGIPNHWRAAARRHADRRRGAAVHRPAVLRARDVPLGRGRRPLRTKQLRAGLTQLGEEGAIQVFRPVAGTVLLLGAVGQLQFEVVAHRLEHEYGVKARIQPARYNVARWVTCDDADGGEKELQRFIDGNAHRVALDAVDAPACCSSTRRAARDAGQLAEDPLPRPARARRAGVPEAAGG